MTDLEITGVIREIQTENPGIFGPNGGYSRAYSLTNLSWNIGLLIGPLLSGSLVQAVGYYYMNFTFGMFHENCRSLQITSSICVLTHIVSSYNNFLRRLGLLHVSSQ